MNVAVIDLLTQTPFYDRYLAEAIARRVDQFCLYASDFHREPGYFDDASFKRSTGGTDIISRYPIRARRVRQVVRVAEYTLNWLILLAKFRRQRPDVVHIQWLPMLNEKITVENLALSGLRRMGIPIVYTVHDYLPHDTGTRHHAVFSRLYASVDHLVVHTATDYRRLIENSGVPEEKVSLIAQGPVFYEQVDVTRAEARKTLGLDEKDIVFLMMGLIRPYKGIEGAIEALDRAAQERPETSLKLIVAGSIFDRQYFQQLQALAEKLGVAALVRWITDYIPSHQVGLYHAAVDVVLFPYHNISQSAAFLTAGGLGKCTVATPVGGLGELIIDGENGVQIESADPAAVTEGLRRCLDLTPEQREAMGRALRDRIQAECGWDTIGQQTVDLYRQIIQHKRAPASS
jgi:glycosyltransferase involved in cell wall biosynthesis